MGKSLGGGLLTRVGVHTLGRRPAKPALATWEVLPEARHDGCTHHSSNSGS